MNDVSQHDEAMRTVWVTRRALSLLFLSWLPISLGVSAQEPPGARRAAATITDVRLRGHVLALAHDSMRGRWTPSPELEKAAQYLASELSQVGLQPGGVQGSYLQRFDIDAIQVLPDSAAVWATGHTAIRWVNGADYAFPFITNLANWDGEGLALLLRGSLGGTPAFDTASVRGSILLLPEGWGQQYLRVASWGPAGMIWLADVADSIFAEIVRGQLRPTRRAPGADSLPVLVMSYDAAAPLLTAAGVDPAGLRLPSTDTLLHAIPLDGTTIHIKGRVRRLRHHQPANVVAILEGSDPELRHEYVVYSAHYDHLGIGKPTAGDSVYNGADDNASGTAAVLAVAGAYRQLANRPRRSILFVLVSAEEFLGLGTRAFLQNPPAPVSAMVANLNADMIGRNWKDTVVVLGRRDSDLGSVVDRVVSSHPELGLVATDSSTRPNEPGDLYSWSDHAFFIEKGIPFLYFYSGMHSDYHRPSDSAEKTDCEKLARISRLMFLVGLEIANTDQRPQWNQDSYRRLVVRP